MAEKLHTSGEVFHYIVVFSEMNGYAPSLQDLKDHFGWQSKNAGWKTVNRLVRDGKLEKDKLGRIKFPSTLRK